VTSKDFSFTLGGSCWQNTLGHFSPFSAEEHVAYQGQQLSPTPQPLVLTVVEAQHRHQSSQCSFITPDATRRYSISSTRSAPGGTAHNPNCESSVTSGVRVCNEDLNLIFSGLLYSPPSPLPFDVVIGTAEGITDYKCRALGTVMNFKHVKQSE